MVPSFWYFVQLIVLDSAGRLREMILRIPVSPSLPAAAGRCIVFLFLCGLPTFGRLRIFARLNKLAKELRRKGENYVSPLLPSLFSV